MPDQHIADILANLRNRRHPETDHVRVWASEDPSDYEMLETDDAPVVRRPDSDAIVHLRIRAVWTFHKNDADPWPSTLHGHHNQKPHKLDAITGRIFNVKTRKHIGAVNAKELRRIQEELLASKDFSERARLLLSDSARDPARP